MSVQTITPADARFIIEDHPLLVDPDSERETKRKMHLSCSEVHTPVTLAELFSSLGGDWPQPMGSMTVVDSQNKENEFTIAWDITGLGINTVSIRQVRVDLAFIPCGSFPMMNFTVEIDDGGDGEALADFNLCAADSCHRVAVHDLVLADTVNVYLFEVDNGLIVSEFVQPLAAEEKQGFLAEARACFAALQEYPGLEKPGWEDALAEICSSFRAGGTPLDIHGLDLYQRRLYYEPAPEVRFWQVASGG